MESAKKTDQPIHAPGTLDSPAAPTASDKQRRARLRHEISKIDVEIAEIQSSADIEIAHLRAKKTTLRNELAAI